MKKKVKLRLSTEDSSMSKILILISMLSMNSCSSIYYGFWETFGQDKRDLLKSEIENSNEDQKDIKEEFTSTLERIKKEYDFDGGELERTYDYLSSRYEDAKKREKKLQNRIDKIEDIGADLFKEWKQEALEIKNPKYRRSSLAKLSRTKTQFAQLRSNLSKTEKMLEVVMGKFKDQVLFLKHNLNAKALGSLKVEFKEIEKGINQLIGNINSSQSTNNIFIERM